LGVVSWGCVAWGIVRSLSQPCVLWAGVANITHSRLTVNTGPYVQSTSKMPKAVTIMSATCKIMIMVYYISDYFRLGFLCFIVF